VAETKIVKFYAEVLSVLNVVCSQVARIIVNLILQEIEYGVDSFGLE
jgi:hypothetical protein